MTTRPFYWSVRRELWENRLIWMAPPIAAGVVLVAYAVVMVFVAPRRHPQADFDPLRQPAAVALPYDVTITMMLAAAFLVWVFYCLDALHGERRDRSILFWKSLPVSDLTTVLAKAAIPLVVLPVVTFVVTVAMHLVMLLVNRGVMLMVGLPFTTPNPFPVLRTWGTLLYGLVAMTLWLAPVYAWLLLVSAWARRATLVWAILPFVALTTLEKVTFQSTHLSSLFTHRWAGWSTEAFASKPRPLFLIDAMNPIAPAKFLSSPSLWLGLAVAALLLFAAARLRRRQTPL